MSCTSSGDDVALIFLWGDRGPTTVQWPVEKGAIYRAATKLFDASPLLAEALHDALGRAIPEDFAYRFPKEWVVESKECDEEEEKRMEQGDASKDKHEDFEHRLVASQAIFARAAYALEKLNGERYHEAVEALNKDFSKSGLSQEENKLLEEERGKARGNVRKHLQRSARLQLTFASLKQKVIEGAKGVVDQEERDYSAAAARYELTGGDSDPEIFAKVRECLAVKGESTPKPVQVRSSKYRPDSARNFLELRQTAKVAQSTLTKLFQENIRVDPENPKKVELMFPDKIKSVDRCVEKAMNDYGGDFGRLVDLSRGSIVCQDVKALEQVLEQIKTLHDKEQIIIHRVKNRLENPAPGGYRDIMMNISMPCRNKRCASHVCELQVHLRAFFTIKNGEGHKLYE